VQTFGRDGANYSTVDTHLSTVVDLQAKKKALGAIDGRGLGLLQAHYMGDPALPVPGAPYREQPLITGGLHPFHLPAPRYAVFGDLSCQWQVEVLTVGNRGARRTRGQGLRLLKVVALRHQKASKTNHKQLLPPCVGLV
jgi:hypothetical protein